MGFFEVAILMVILFVIGLIGFRALRSRYSDLKKQSEWRYMFSSTFLAFIILMSLVFFAIFSMFILLGASQSYLADRTNEFLTFPRTVVWFPLISGVIHILKEDGEDPNKKRDASFMFLITLFLYLVFFNL